ncbi:leucyl aminopeptidase family protein [Sphingorhabdus buctiana]|uniref:Leucyl aminopeptidase family protein n=1 Tax=Sphingorhabdus buctiana TaxID=1508805 RepID=A0ABW4MDL0_9SPHN
MTDYSNLIQPDSGQAATEIEIISKEGFADWFSAQPGPVRAAASAQKFDGSVGDFAILHIPGSEDWKAALIVSDAAKLEHWSLAKAAEALPEGTYRLKGAETGDALLGWLLGQYRFDEYRSEPKLKGARILFTSEPGRIENAVRQAEATALVRDMVNRPPIDLGPQELEAEAARLAKAHKGKLHVTKGHELQTGYPLIHAVGMAASRDYAPRLIELEWGDERHPRVAIVGKGVVFDSGGLDIKSAVGMRLMKKDMGGAAHALALADLIMKAHLPVRLHLLVAAVENCVSGGALRPGDIVKSRAGIHVEIDNTDAEGRLILADALAKAVEDKADLIVNFATLTGAARVALGPDLPALFANDDELADALLAAGKDVADPLWRLPLWKPYADMLDSDIADTANAGGGFAGAITAALFMQKFVPDEVRWAHLDTFAWRPTAKAGRPKGGEALGLRAVYRYLSQAYPVR